MKNAKPSITSFASDSTLIQSLKHIGRGVEKEGLRIDDHCHVSQIDHPASVGSTLTHPSITTDYSEALLEFITPVMNSPEQTIEYLADLHRYTLDNIGSETIWPASMPCRLIGDDSIPIAKYGTSNVGQLKHVYRQGLGVRYGRIMQSIAGIHYNFSLPESFWQHYQELLGDSSDLQDFISSHYFLLIRNFRRYSWLLYYLFGASPVLDKSFLNGRDHALQQFTENTFGLEYATSLRMSDLGYQNSAQEDLHISYNSLEDYVTTLGDAVKIPYQPYEEIGVKRGDEFIQLNANILQIENEYYSDIRPKRVTKSGEKPISALQTRGVEYIEVRILDINPYLAEGIDAKQIKFLDSFLLFCALSECPGASTTTSKDVKANQKNTILNGRHPEHTIITDGDTKPFKEVANDLLNCISEAASLLDATHQSTQYTDSVEHQRNKVDNPDMTASGKIMQQVSNGVEFVEQMQSLAKTHKSHFLAQQAIHLQDDEMRATAEKSLQDQRQLEQNDRLSFEEFLTVYNQS